MQRGTRAEFDTLLSQGKNNCLKKADGGMRYDPCEMVGERDPCIEEWHFALKGIKEVACKDVQHFCDKDS